MTTTHPLASPLPKTVSYSAERCNPLKTLPTIYPYPNFLIPSPSHHDTSGDHVGRARGRCQHRVLRVAESCCGRRKALVVQRTGRGGLGLGSGLGLGLALVVQRTGRGGLGLGSGLGLGLGLALVVQRTGRGRS
jgi:hypothetical protein